MPGTYKISDALERLGVSAPLGLNGNGVHAFECLRLLTGTVNLEHKVTGKVLALRYCHLTENKRRLKSNSLSEVVNFAFNSSLNLEDISDYLNRTRAINRGFWEGLRGEICW